jgi:hypothetical protein
VLLTLSPPLHFSALRRCSVLASLSTTPTPCSARNRLGRCASSAATPRTHHAERSNRATDPSTTSLGNNSWLLGRSARVERLGRNRKPSDLGFELLGVEPCSSALRNLPIEEERIELPDPHLEKLSAGGQDRAPWLRRERETALQARGKRRVLLDQSSEAIESPAQINRRQA